MMLEVGQVMQEYKGHAEGVQFNMDDTGATMLVFFNNPTPKEKEQFKSENKFEIRFLDINDAVIITVKIGNLEWMDAPYSPHLSKNLTVLQEITEGTGYSLTLVLINSVSGKIETMRLIGLNTRFSQNLRNAILKLREKPFDRTYYRNTLNNIFARFTTKKLVDMSANYYKE